MNLDLTPLAWRLAGTPLAAWANGVQQQLNAKLESATVTCHAGAAPSTRCPR